MLTNEFVDHHFSQPTSQIFHPGSIHAVEDLLRFTHAGLECVRLPLLGDYDDRLWQLDLAVAFSNT